MILALKDAIVIGLDILRKQLQQFNFFLISHSYYGKINDRSAKKSLIVESNILLSISCELSPLYVI